MHHQSIVTQLPWDEAPIERVWDDLLAIHPLVVDTNVLISDVIASMRTPAPSQLLTLARLGKIRIFAATHVDHEMRMHLPRVAREYNHSPIDALERWMVEYLPVIKFIDVPHLDLDDPRPGRVQEQDPDDVPTAELVAMLAPVLSVSKDWHLVNTGVARAEWGFVVKQARALATKDTLVVSTSITVTTGIDLGARAVRATIRPIRLLPTPVAVGAGAILLATGALWLRHQKTTPNRSAYKGPSPKAPWIQATLDWVKMAGLMALWTLNRTLDEADVALDILESRKIASVTNNEIDRVVTVRLLAQALAVAPRPMTATELVKALSSSPHASRADVNAALLLLRTQPAFMRIGASRWQLGVQKSTDLEAIVRMRQALPAPIFNI